MKITEPDKDSDVYLNEANGERYIAHVKGWLRTGLVGAAISLAVFFFFFALFFFFLCFLFSTSSPDLVLYVPLGRRCTDPAALSRCERSF